MRVLTTGADGFAGRHLAAELVRHGHEVIGFDRQHRPPCEDVREAIAGDLQDRDAVLDAVRRVKPDACVHLGALTFVPEGHSAPRLMLSVNVLGTLNVLAACLDAAPKARLLVVSSAHVYGSAHGDEPLPETAPLLPETLYAVSKAAADVAALAHARRHGMHVMTVRPNNHTGPGQTGHFVVPAFAGQIKAIAKGETDPVLRVGNLQSVRDFSDVRDVVKAYRLLIERGRPRHAYNVSARHRIEIGDLLHRLCAIARVEPRIEVDPELYRPKDASPLLDTRKVKEHTGWEASIPLDRTLHDVMGSA